MAKSRIAEAYVQVVPTTDGIAGALKKEFDDVAEPAGKSLGGGIFSAASKFIGPLAAAFAGAAIFTFAKDSVTAASDLNEAGTAVTQIFGTATQNINNWASSAATGLGQSKLEALNAAKSFGVFGAAAGLAGQENADFSMKLAGLASDMASFHNASPEEVIQALGAGLRGEAEPLRRFGILMDDASLKAQAMKLGIYDGNGSLTQQQRVLAANALVFDQAGAAMGDFSRTSEGLANQQRIAKAQMENFKASLGEAFLPAVTAVVSVLNKQFIPALKDVLDAAKAAWTWITDNSDWLVPVALGLGIVYVGLLLYGAGLKIAEEGVGNLAKATAKAMMAQIGLNTAMFANPIGLIIVAVVALIAALVWFFTQTELGQQVWSNIMNAIGVAFTWLWEVIIKPVVDAIVVAWNWLVESIQAAWEFWNAVFVAIGAAFTWLWETILKPIFSLIFLAVGIFAAIVVWLWETAVMPIINAIGAIFQWLWDFIVMPYINLIVAYVQMWGAIFTWLWQNIIQPVFGFIGAIFTWLYENIVLRVINGIVNVIQGLGAVFKWLYENVVKPVFEALGVAFNWVWLNVIKPVVDFISNAIRTIGDVVSSVFGFIGNFIADTFNGIIGAIKAPINAVIGFLNMLIDGLNQIKIDIPDWVPEWGGKTIGFSIPNIPQLANGGVLATSGSVMVGEAGPEILTLPKGAQVTPLDKAGGGQTLIYNAAPDKSIDEEQALFSAMRRAKVVAGW